ncbi:glycosyltransferase family protein [Moorena bouillonii]|uniref:Spore protein YkvP/CgeB glycosyl transferase-like domain-containing protein n=1 Tax=Moorena bouillonii PNG TaxID=568701 RepID=A0A1U7N5K1_9CYAN|nr:glycosyltransferase [Moorena bouillonii]OLT61233.1 hypothetical protein BJP37_21645 [Moorena bouillonii PNG]
MKIFTAIRHSIDPNLYYGDLWSGNFYPALKQLGHEIIESQVDLLPASRFMQIASNFTPQEKEVRAQITQKIVDEVRQAHQKQPLNLFISYFYNAHFDPAGFKEINQLGIPTVNFYCNNIHQFELVSEIATQVNFSWHAERNARAHYLKIGANPIWVQMGADPKVYYPISGINRRHKACFVGQRYADRDRFIANLIQNKVPVSIYGKGWGLPDTHDSKQTLLKEESKYLGRKLPKAGGISGYANVVCQNINNQGLISGLRRTVQQFQYRHQSRTISPLLASVACGFAKNLCYTFSEYEVILNFSNVWADGRPGSELIPHVRLRDFEAPMCRSCYLTGYTNEIAEFYEIGKEIDTYQSPEELVDKTKFYLNHPTEAEKLREAGYQRALRDHTWTNRFEELFQKIGLANKN